MNGFLEKMGYGPEDRVLITHIDDIGFCHASNVASFECLEVGAASCGSILTAAPWFLEAAELCKANPDYDVGVHLTLTCEYSTFRWPALSTRDVASGLLDSQCSRLRLPRKRKVSVTSASAMNNRRAMPRERWATSPDVRGPAWRCRVRA